MTDLLNPPKPAPTEFHTADTMTNEAKSTEREEFEAHLKSTGWYDCDLERMSNDLYSRQVVRYMWGIWQHQQQKIADLENSTFCGDEAFRLAKEVIADLERQLEQATWSRKVLSEQVDDLEQQLVDKTHALNKAERTLDEYKRMYDSANNQLTEQKRVAQVALDVLAPLLDYGHSRKDLPLGSSIVSEAIKAWKERDELKRVNVELRDVMVEMDRRFRLNDWTNKTVAYLDEFRKAPVEVK